jgi:glycosyltransferase involved in cell wall biosynthesis
MKVLGFHDNSACGLYRMLQPFAELAAHGHQMLANYGDRQPDGDEDLIVAERFDKTEALPSWRRWKARHRLVYEVDDDVFAVDPVNFLAWRTYRSPVPREVATFAAQAADLVTASTEPLAEVFRREAGHDRVLVLPNYVDEGLLQLERPHRDRLVVGWRGGASHGRDLAMLAGQLRRFLARNPRVEFHIIGTDFRETVKGKARWTDWSDNIWDFYRSVDFDVAVVPLYPTTFAESKSHIPVLEMAALGIPVVASDATAYREFVLDGVTGFLVRREHEWGRRLYQLANDEAMRLEMGAKAREHAAAFTIQRNWQQWERAYQSLL